MAHAPSRWRRLRSLLLVDDAAPWANPGPTPDALILDRVATDATAPAAAAWLRHWRSSPDGPALLVAVGGLDTGEAEATLSAVMPERPDAIVLRAAADAAAIQHLGVKLGVHEALNAWPAGSTAIVAEVGDPAGVFGLGDLKAVGPRLAGLTWNAQTLASACGMDPAVFAAPDGPGLVVRTTLVLAAATLGIGAYETAGLPRSLQDGPGPEAMGFTGQMTRDPGQVGVLNALFDRTRAG